jgi:hypothetical protein
MAITKGVPSVTNHRIAAAIVILISLSLPACTHVVGFHPVQKPPEIDSKTDASVSLYMKPELAGATHSFRAAGSGIANKWVVPYGARVREFAVEYLSAAFSDFKELSAPAKGSGSNADVEVTSVDYAVKGQAAHVAIDIQAIGATGEKILAEQYSTRGRSGHGVVFAGGAFAQKGATRSSTDQALREIFLKFVEDLRAALKAKSGLSDTRSLSKDG